MTISVVIPAYNEENYLPRTLASLTQLDRKPDEVIVIDGGSTDKTADVARAHGAKVLTIEHRGIGFARQKGLEAAAGEVVAFTDADSIVPKDWLKRHCETLSQTGVVMTCGTFSVADGTFPYVHYINYLQPLLYRFAYLFFGLSICSGQNMAFWREKARSIGGFNVSLLVMEDIDLAVRMKTVGRVLYLPDVAVSSSGRRSQEGWRFFVRAGTAAVKYFLFQQKNLSPFPDYRE